MDVARKVIEKEKIIKNTRLEYIDVARGIAIILMIFAHTCHEPISRRIIYSFHMPIFFITSGYFYKNKDLKNEFKKDFYSLLLPYFITCSIVCLVNFIKNTNTLVIDIKTSLLGIGVTYGIFEGLSSVGPIWFLTCLCFSKVLFCIINKMFKSKQNLLIVCLSFNLIGFFISRVVYLPFSLDVMLITQIYLYIGKYIREKKLFERNLSVKKIIILLFLWAVGIILGEFSYVDRFYPYYPLCIITTICASYLFIIICKYFLEKKFFKKISKILQFCGTYSLYILCIHTIEKEFVNYNFLIHTSMNRINNILIFILKMILITIITLIFIYIKEFINKRKEMYEGND